MQPLCFPLKLLPRIPSFVMPWLVIAGMTVAMYQPGAARAEDQSTAPFLTGQVDVGQVTGGAESNTAWNAHVHSFMFADMLKKALKERGLSGAGGGRFVVSAEMLEFKTPDLNSFNFDGFVAASVRYRVTIVRDNALIFETRVRTERSGAGHHPTGTSPARI